MALRAESDGLKYEAVLVQNRSWVGSDDGWVSPKKEAWLLLSPARSLSGLGGGRFQLYLQSPSGGCGCRLAINGQLRTGTDQGNPTV